MQRRTEQKKKAGRGETGPDRARLDSESQSGTFDGCGKGTKVVEGGFLLLLADGVSLVGCLVPATCECGESRSLNWYADKKRGSRNDMRGRE